METEVDYNKMADISVQIKNTGIELKKIMNCTESVVLSVAGEWQGEAETAYAANIIAVKRQFENIENFYTELADKVGIIADKYYDFDTNLTSEINKI